MAYTPIENRLGIQPIAAANVPNSVANAQIGQSPFFGKAHPLGTIIRAYDPVYGEGEFIYLQLASTQVVGSSVTWTGFGTVSGDTGNESQFQASLAAAATTPGTGLQVGIAMSAFPSGSPATAFGWFQIGGNAVAKVDASGGGGAVTAGGPVGPGTAAGILSKPATPPVGKALFNAMAVSAAGTPAAGFAVVEINRPFMEPLAT